MNRMVPSIFRFDPDAPDSGELRYYLRHAGSLLAASDLESPERAVVLRRARAWVAAALAGLDQLLDAAEGPAVPDASADRSTEAHGRLDLELPSLVRPTGGRR